MSKVKLPGKEIIIIGHKSCTRCPIFLWILSLLNSYFPFGPVDLFFFCTVSVNFRCGKNSWNKYYFIKMVLTRSSLTIWFQFFFITTQGVNIQHIWTYTIINAEISRSVYVCRITCIKIIWISIKRENRAHKSAVDI